jgi:prophage regulatory protein
LWRNILLSTDKRILIMANQSANNTESTNTQPQAERLLRLPDVLSRIPVSASTWWAWVKEGKAPTGVKLGQRVTAWRESDINRMVNNLWGA